ncbi:MAG: ABC transporter ATP-binding protein [Streblomastix strix]|uniref:ABC transporter ATP-binding protein n=1 Tax=Streblomastix strix TaxID=222440 RepID=A0A5J4W2U7_9EUKA|nr:MAG: ABC transporter ATP-binding protein [Streblomastix strix]
MVIGGSGSGKSTLGSAIIGDIDRLSGEVKHIGSIAYCPQTPWINNQTIQENITFGQEYNEVKYNDVVHVCALKQDFETLPAGDQTAIGEKGVNLSGGQKARIQLARAVYSDRDIYILDDPLSGADANVGKFLFDECITGRLKDKTRILMTNQLQFIQKADKIIFLKQGRIRAQGSYQEMLDQGIDLSKYIKKDLRNQQYKFRRLMRQNTQFTLIPNEADNLDQNTQNEQKKEEEEDTQATKTIQVAQKIITREEFETKAVPWSHQFFDTTPMGRILNRLTLDLTNVDKGLYNMFIQFIGTCLGLVGQVVIISVNTPFFLTIGIPSLIFQYIINKLYSRASRNLLRMVSRSKSPIFQIFDETISKAGLSIIRAYKLQDVWRGKFVALNDHWGVRYVLFLQGKKINSFVSTVFMGGVVILGWFFMNPAVLSVAISASLTFSSLSSLLIQQSTELESNMTSFGRIQFYSTKIPQEKSRSEIDSFDPPQDFPTQGSVQFDNVSFRYRSGLQYALDVDFQLKGREKIGVCGRTGSGKSSLLFPLFRLIELDPTLQPTMIDVRSGLPIETDPNEEPNRGRILIDGIDISKIDITKLRHSIACIPQNPTLFTGTLRFNLDIGYKYINDDRLWEVLDLIGLKQDVEQLPEGLDTQIADGGSNFSAGQRQLICFGRAILKNCRIVVMDEVTASVDMKHDAKIQKVIQEQFVDKTVIMIAHRLNTLIHCDHIIVMSDGKIIEFDTPARLQNTRGSVFNELMKNMK